MNKKLILASASPRRQELLKLICEDFSVVPANIEETYDVDIPTFKVPEEISKLKANAIAKIYPESIVLAADTCVIIDNVILGKPKNCTEAFEMLSKLSGKVHFVITGCTIVSKEKSISFSVKTSVEFFKLSKKEIEDYIKTNEPFDKSGAYGIQGKGSLLVKKITGDYFNVVGLPVSLIKRALDKY